MWIRTQNKQRIVNSDQIIDIFVDKTGTIIYANTNVGHHELGDTSQFILGEYQDRDTCLKVLDHIAVVMGSIIPGIPMPLGGEVETWVEGIEKIAAVNIAHKFVK